MFRVILYFGIKCIRPLSSPLGFAEQELFRGSKEECDRFVN